MVIRAALFDLDDTLFPQAEWLAGAWDAVAEAGTEQDLDEEAFRDALDRIASLGSDRGKIIDRALDRVGAAGVAIEPLVAVFRAHRPPALNAFPGVRAGIERLRRRVRVGVVTDGDPTIQRGKLVALGLDECFDAVVLSDEMGRARRKPHPAPFLAALDSLGVRSSEAVFVGDRPEKDVTGASTLGMHTIRVTTGEYSGTPDLPSPTATVPDAAHAIRLIEEWALRSSSDPLHERVPERVPRTNPMGRGGR